MYTISPFYRFKKTVLLRKKKEEKKEKEEQKGIRLAKKANL